MDRFQFRERFSSGIHLLDGATGTELRKAGMPDNRCGEQWIIGHPGTLISLQKAYAEAGSEIVYAPTFRAQPLALKRWRLEAETARINRELLAISRTAAPGCVIAGNLTTMQGCGTDDLSEMRDAYRIQMEALINGGADILAAETLMSMTEAELILETASDLSAPAVMISFASRDEHHLFSGETITDAVRAAEAAGAAAAGVNCLAASETLPDLIGRLRAATTVPLICKPNAGYPVKGRYPVGIPQFLAILLRCAENGADLIGGCCGTTPEYIREAKKQLKRLKK